MITRRLALTGLAAAAAAPALAQAPAIRISTAAPPSDFLARLLERLRTDLEGQLAVTVHPASTLFRQGTEVQALQRGNLEMSTMTTFEVAQQVPELGFLNRGSQKLVHSKALAPRVLLPRDCCRTAVVGAGQGNACLGSHRQRHGVTGAETRWRRHCHAQDHVASVYPHLVVVALGQRLDDDARHQARSGLAVRSPGRPLEGIGRSRTFDERGA